ncbi:hypothetical protein OE88DRAFT_1140532 [Heliocybe sulcata]|uniref:Uncharacterized protein n=1 Tax=Heliocybe sulcata TaxID=5364 RepID=A0A5C3NC46_9AGAM|nr:hypothetical protein OE88DRAFT_1140532 [Heliocybe sulcata]
MILDLDAEPDRIILDGLVGIQTSSTIHNLTLCPTLFTSDRIRVPRIRRPDGRKTAVAYLPSSSRQSAGSAQSAADRDRIVKSHIEEHPDWEDYMKSTCVSTVYRQFKFVQGRIDFWHGATTPPDLPVAPKAKIGPTHVLRAMKLTTDWGARTERGTWTRESRICWKSTRGTAHCPKGMRSSGFCISLLLWAHYRFRRV